jgi:hypothetical protein
MFTFLIGNIFHGCAEVGQTIVDFPQQLVATLPHQGCS